MTLETAEQNPEKENITSEVPVESVVEKNPEVKYEMDREGYITSFHEMTDDQIAEHFIRNEPKGFQGVAGIELGGRWKRILSMEQENKRARLKEETGKELTRNERLGIIWKGTKSLAGSPVYAAAGAATVLGTFHGAAHTASQMVISFKRMWSGLTGKHFDESDNSKWYNRVANKGI